MSLLRVLLFVVTAPWVWCCSAVSPVPAKQIDVPRSTQLASTVALVDDDGSYCAGVWIDQARVLTANHCVADLVGNAVVEDFDHHRLVGTVGKTDARADLALVSVQDAPQHAFAPLARSWAVGEPLTIVGMPAGIDWTLLHGWIANELVHQSADGQDGDKAQMLWVQVPAWYGNSGGGAFSDAGELVGICSMRSLKIPDQSWFVAPRELHAFLAHTGS